MYAVGKNISIGADTSSPALLLFSEQQQKWRRRIRKNKYSYYKKRQKKTFFFHYRKTAALKIWGADDGRTHRSTQRVCARRLGYNYANTLASRAFNSVLPGLPPPVSSGDPSVVIVARFFTQRAGPAASPLLLSHSDHEWCVNVFQVGEGEGGAGDKTKHRFGTLSLLAVPTGSAAREQKQMPGVVDGILVV